MLKIPLLTLIRKNSLYRGPTDSQKFTDYFEEVFENLQNYAISCNELNTELNNFKNELHFILESWPTAKRKLRLLEEKFKSHLIDERS